MAKPEMWKKYLELQQRDQTVNIYAAELVRLNCFASTLVVKEEERAHLFQKWLRYKIKKHLVAQAFMTYSEVFEVACRVEQVLR